MSKERHENKGDTDKKDAPPLSKRAWEETETPKRQVPSTTDVSVVRTIKVQAP